MKTELIIKFTIVIIMCIASTLFVKAEETTKSINSLSQIVEMAKESGNKIVLKRRLIDVSKANEKDSLNSEHGSPSTVLRISSRDLESGKFTIRASDGVNFEWSVQRIAMKQLNLQSSPLLKGRAKQRTTA